MTRTPESVPPARWARRRSSAAWSLMLAVAAAVVVPVPARGASAPPARSGPAAVDGYAPQVVVDDAPAAPAVVLVGTLGHSPAIDRLVAAGRLDVTGIAGRWETSLQQVVDDPMPGVARALVIAGSGRSPAVPAQP